MLDPATYEQSLQIALQQPEVQRRAEIHSLTHFEERGVPITVVALPELRRVLNTMQENRFDLYMQEMDGLDDLEFASFVDMCRKLITFQFMIFPHRRPVLPLSVLMSVKCLFRKLCGANPEFRTVLEIGPGTGYLSLILSNWGLLGNYSQVEACQTFYLLQNLLNADCFVPHYVEHALDDIPDTGFWKCLPDQEDPASVTLPDEVVLCEHFPWWKLDELATRRFDIVTANANWLEMNPAALDDYLTLLPKVLNPDGAIVSQCLGTHVYGGPEFLFQKFTSADFKLVDYRVTNNIHNAAWVRSESQVDLAAMKERVYDTRPAGRRHYSISDIVTVVEGSFYRDAAISV